MAERIYSGLTLTTSDEIARLTHANANLTEVYTKLYAMTKNEEYYEKACFHAEKNLSKASVSFTPGEFHYLKIGGAHYRYAMVYLEKQKYEEALAHSDKAIEVIVGQIGESDIDSATAYWFKAQALFGLERYEQARSLAQKSAEIYSDFLGFCHPDTYRIYIRLGDCCAKLGEAENAVDAYSKALEIAERIYEPGSPHIKAASERIVSAKK
jgi:tetratricopeptide (TPR) repeat protein